MAKLEKVNVSTGIYWIAVPEVDLYIQCGCPADSVKFLMKRGLIVNKEENGVVFETGPNAILLSDILIQKGGFSNLAEFPVMQILYRQGRLIPGHPNNTGIKPLLIGREEQVNAQMQYIYRGNYGLISEEEINSTGAKPEHTKPLARWKQKFAFDNMKKSEEFLDSCIVKDEAVEIRNGVFIKRLSLNIFEFSYQGETVTVDLNLNTNDYYNPPYQLGFHKTTREYFSIIHSGNGDGWDINRPCMSSIVVFQGKIYLIDAGPNLLHTLTALGIGVNEIEGIFHTHSHDDHFAGLSTLIRGDHKLKYFATPLIRSSVTKKFSALLSMNENNFEQFFEVHDLELDKWNNVDGLEVKPALSPHPVETNIYFFRAMGEKGCKTYAHLADISALEVLNSMLTDDPEKSGISFKELKKVEETYLSKVDLKKIDIGGGLIHGDAEDFKTDSSEKIILSHLATPLTNRQKEIGSEAPFGMVDTLIPSHQNYIFQYASKYLKNYFPTIPTYELNALLNCPVVSSNAGSILVKQGESNPYIYLIISGCINAISSEQGTNIALTAGAMIGLFSGLIGFPSIETYRTASNTLTLKIPSSLYQEVVKKNNLYSQLEKLEDSLIFLQKNKIFGESISFSIQKKIAENMEAITYDKGNFSQLDLKPGLYLLEEGELELFLKNKKIKTLFSGDFYGEETILFGRRNLFKIHALKRSKVFYIPRDIVSNVPLVIWKLLETFEKRLLMKKYN